MVPNSIMRWLGPLVICLLGVVLVFGNPLSKHALCDETQNCLLSWVGALSGWAAAAGAFYAAVVTLGPLREQAREARRQSDFLVGDTEPEFFLVRSVNEGCVKLGVTNWNRRTTVIERVECICPATVTDCRALKEGRSPNQAAKSRRQGALRLDGWLNRSKGPLRRYFPLVLYENDTVVEGVLAEQSLLQVEVSFKILGQQQERRRSTVIALMAHEPISESGSLSQ